MNNTNNLQEQFENLIKQGQELLEKMKENQNADVSKKVRKPKLIENGTKFGRLTVIGLDHINEYVDSKGQKRRIQFYLCECDCGNKTVVCRNSLKCANTKSCGCYNVECLVKRHKKHNMAGTKIYKVWTGMKKRCYNKNEPMYKNYGARGIVVCDEWINNFESFYNWAMKTGYKEGLSIDRIDYNGNYEPNNCRWATQIQQQNNKRSNKYIIYNGKKDTLANWCRNLGLNYKVIGYRLNSLGWNVEKAFNTDTLGTEKLKLIFRID